MNASEITKKLVKFRTVKGNDAEIERCLDFIEGYFDNFEVRRFEKNGDTSVVVSFEGGREPEILLHGHIDVVEAPEEQFRPEVREGKIYGRGAADMKAGVACLMKVMKDLKELENSPPVVLMLTSDEERGGFNGAGYLINKVGYSPDFGISAEPNREEGFMDITIKQKGVLQLRLTTEGEEGHGSEVENLENAAAKLVRAYSEIENLFEDSGNTTLNLSHMESGDAINKVPGSAEMTLDIRYTDDYPADAVLNDIKRVGEVDVEVVARAPMLDNDSQNRYIQDLKEALNRVTGEGELRMKKSASDMRFLTSNGTPAVVFGPEGYDIHGENEHAVISSFKPYYDTVMEFCLGQEGEG